MTNKVKQRNGFLDSFGIEYIPQGVINKIKVKSDDSIMSWFYRFQRIYDHRKKFVRLYEFIFS